MKSGKVFVAVGVVAICVLGVMLLPKDNPGITVRPVYLDSDNSIKRRPPVVVAPRLASPDSSKDVGREEYADQPSFGEDVDYDKSEAEVPAESQEILDPGLDTSSSAPVFRELSDEEVTQLKLKDYQQYLRYEKQRKQLERGEEIVVQEITEAQRKRIVHEELKPKLLEQLATKRAEGQKAGVEASATIEGAK